METYKAGHLVAMYAIIPKREACGTRGMVPLKKTMLRLLGLLK